jgi:hypothetical protein
MTPRSPRLTSKLTRLAALSLSALLATGCDGCQNDKARAAAADATTPDASMTISLAPPGASSLAPMTTGFLTKFFPKDGDGGYKRVLSGEKQGYAEAKLEKDGKEVALVSITDATRLAYTKQRFETSTEKIGDLPVLRVNDEETSALVNNRFYVKVYSTKLDHEARKAILASFDLKSLGSS